MVDEEVIDDPQNPPLPKGFTAVKSGGIPPLPKGFTPIEKKNNSPFPTHGYQPTAQDLKDKQHLNDLESSFDKLPNTFPQSNSSLNPFQNSQESSDLLPVLPENREAVRQQQKTDAHSQAIQTAQQQRQTIQPPITQNTDRSIMDQVGQAIYLPAVKQGFNDLIVKPLAGATDFVDRTIDKAYTGITGEKTPEWMRESKNSIFKSVANQIQKEYDTRDKPTNIVSDVAEGAIGTLPLMASMYTGAGEAGMAAKAPQLFGQLSKVLATTKGLSAYHDATKNGDGYGASLVKSGNAAVEGGLEGGLMEAQMLVGGAMGKGVIKQLEEKGLLKGGETTKAIIHALAVATTFGGTSAGEDLLQGKDINTDNALKQFGTGLAFEAIPIIKALHGGLSEHIEGKKINSDAAQAAVVSNAASNINGESALRTLINTPLETIKQVHSDISDNHETLYANSIEKGAKAYDTKDINEKRDLYAQQMALKAQGDIKLIADKVSDPETLSSIRRSIGENPELSDEQVQNLHDKIDALTPNTESESNSDNINKQEPIKQQENESTNQKNGEEGSSQSGSEKSSDENGVAAEKEVGKSGDVKAEPDNLETDNLVADKAAENKEFGTDYSKKTDAELEKRQQDIEGNGNHSKEFNSIDKELEKRERESVFNKPLSEVNDSLDSILKKNKEMPNGFGSYAERRDIRESKDVVEKYLNSSDITDSEIKKDFSEALFGNPDTWYADGLKLRESFNLANERGIDLKLLKEKFTERFINDGYSEKDADDVLARKLLKLQPVESNAKPESPEVVTAISKSDGKVETKGQTNKTSSAAIDTENKPTKTSENDTQSTAPPKDNTGTTKSVDKPVQQADEKTVKAKNASTDETLKKYGLEIKLPDEKRSREVVEKDATKAISDGFDINELIDKIHNDKHEASDTETFILAKKLGATDDRLTEINSKLEADGATMSDKSFHELTNEKGKLLSDLEDVGSALKETGRATARGLGSRRFAVKKDLSLSDLIVQKREANGGEKLSESQLSGINERYKELQDTKTKLEAALKLKEEENIKLRASQAVKNARIARKSVAKGELKEQLSNEFKSIRDEFAKIRKSGQLMSDIPYRRELAVIARHLPSILNNLKQQGVIELKDIINRIHDEFKDDIPDLNKRDILGVLAGEHNEDRQTKSEVQGGIRELRAQAKLIAQIEDLEAGIKKQNATPKSIKEKSNTVRDLQARLKALGESDTKDLDAIKKRIITKIEELQRRLDNKEYEAPIAKEKTQLDAEALELQRKYDRIKKDFAIEIAKDQLARRSDTEKLKDNLLNIVSLPRALKASLDFSAVLRQGLFLAPHLKESGTAFKEMFGQTFSEKRYQDWISDLKHTEMYDLMKKSDLYLSDKDDPKLLAREEEFTSNLADKIPVIGKAIAASERAYTGYLNVLRAGVFTSEAQKLIERGYTFDKNPSEFESLAKVVNVLSGRGDIPEWLGGKQPKILSNALFSPRFMAARIQTLYLWADPRLSKNARALAAKDIGKTLGSAATILSLAALAGYRVVLDPRSANFLKIEDKQKHGSTFYDIVGGLPQYVRLLAQLGSGKRVPYNGGIQSLTTGQYGKPTRLSVASSFLRGKLSPLVGAGVNLMEGKDVVGQPYHAWPNLPMEFVPLPFSDVQEAYKVGGINGGLKALLPSQFGIGVSSYDPKSKH